MTSPAPAVSSSPSRIRYLVLAALCLLAALAYIQRGSLAVPATTIQGELELNEKEMARILSAFFFGYAFFQIPCGWLGDRWGPRRALTLFLILGAFATSWMTVASGFLGLWIGWFLNGIAQAGLFPSCVNTISRWFPPKEKAFPSGMLGSFMSVGGVISLALTGLLLELNLSWQTILLLYAVPGFAAAFLFYSWFRDRPHEHPQVNQAELDFIGPTSPLSATATPTVLPLLTMLTSLRMAMVCGQQFFRAAGYIFYMTWFPTFLQKSRDVPDADSGYLGSLPFAGVIVGSAAGGVVMDWILKKTNSRPWSRKGVALFSVLSCATLVCLAYPVQEPLLVTAILTVASICAGLCGPAGYTVTIDLGGSHVTTVFSTMNMMGNFGAALMPLVVVQVVEVSSWNEALLVLAACYFLAAICWAVLNVRGSIFPDPPLAA
jgi:MFS family permease